MLDSKTSANGAGVLVITQDPSMGKHQGGTSQDQEPKTKFGSSCRPALNSAWGCVPGPQDREATTRTIFTLKKPED